MSSCDFFVGIRYGIHFPRNREGVVLAAVSSLGEPYCRLGCRDERGKKIRTVERTGQAGRFVLCLDRCGSSAGLSSIYPGVLSVEGESCPDGTPHCEFTVSGLSALESSDAAAELRRIYEMILVAAKSQGVVLDEVRVGWAAITYDNS